MIIVTDEGIVMDVTNLHTGLMERYSLKMDSSGCGTRSSKIRVRPTASKKKVVPPKSLEEFCGLKSVIQTKGMGNCESEKVAPPPPAPECGGCEKIDISQYFKPTKVLLLPDQCPLGGSEGYGIRNPICSWFASPKYFHFCASHRCKPCPVFNDKRRLCSAICKEPSRRLSSNTLHTVRSLGDMRAWSSCCEDQRRYFLEKMMMGDDFGGDEGQAHEAAYENMISQKDDEIERLKRLLRDAEGKGAGAKKSKSETQGMGATESASGKNLVDKNIGTDSKKSSEAEDSASAAASAVASRAGSEGAADASQAGSKSDFAGQGRAIQERSMRSEEGEEGAGAGAGEEGGGASGSSSSSVSGSKAGLKESGSAGQAAPESSKASVKKGGSDSSLFGDADVADGGTAGTDEGAAGTEAGGAEGAQGAESGGDEGGAAGTEGAEGEETMEALRDEDGGGGGVDDENVGEDDEGAQPDLFEDEPPEDLLGDIKPVGSNEELSAELYFYLPDEDDTDSSFALSGGKSQKFPPGFSLKSLSMGDMRHKVTCRPCNAPPPVPPCKLDQQHRAVARFVDPSPCPSGPNVKDDFATLCEMLLRQGDDGNNFEGMNSGMPAITPEEFASGIEWLQQAVASMNNAMPHTCLFPGNPTLDTCQRQLQALQEQLISLEQQLQVGGNFNNPSRDLWGQMSSLPQGTEWGSGGGGGAVQNAERALHHLCPQNAPGFPPQGIVMENRAINAANYNPVGNFGPQLQQLPPQLQFSPLQNFNVPQQNPNYPFQDPCACARFQNHNHTF